MNGCRGFISLVAMALIALGSLVIGGGGYMYYSLQQLSAEDQRILEETNTLKSASLDDSVSEVEVEKESDVESEGSQEQLTASSDEKNLTGQKNAVAKEEDVPSSNSSETLLVPAPVSPSLPKSDLFTPRCTLSPQNIGFDDYVFAKLRIYEGQNEGLNKNYEISWNYNDVSGSGDKEGKFKFDQEGSYNISVTVKHKVYNQTIVEDCGSVYVECDEFDCLSPEEQRMILRKEALDDIIDLIDDWYSNEYPSLTPAYQCSTAESIVRAHLYEYTTAGGINAPEFSAEKDCSNDLAPKAYKYKIELLRSTL